MAANRVKWSMGGVENVKAKAVENGTLRTADVNGRSLQRARGVKPKDRQREILGYASRSGPGRRSQARKALLENLLGKRNGPWRIFMRHGRSPGLRHFGRSADGKDPCA